MELMTFYDNFDLLADAPNGISKLREMVLQLAVQGKLVPQNPNDEPASVLLDKIKAEKEQLSKKGKVKKLNQLKFIGPEELPYEIPSGWEWVRLKQISINVHYGYTASADNTINEIRMLRITDIQNGRVNWDLVPGCKIEKKKLDQFILGCGDLLIARTGGTIGKTFLVDELPVSAVFASYLIRVVPSTHIYPPYLKVFSGSRLYWNQLFSKTSGTGQPNVNATALKTLTLPIPPINEQKRIVAKVDELMALCDDMEARKQKVYHTCINLNDSSISKLVSASTQDNFNKSWNRIHRNFNLLYSELKNITKLRQAILQLAVQGKLVPQDSNDEPAPVLLKRINDDHIQLVTEGKRKKFKPLPEIDKNNAPFPLPKGWEWARFPEIGEFARGKSKHRPRNAPELYKDGTIPVVQTGDVARSNGVINSYTGLYNKVGLAQSQLWRKGTMCITIAANIADSGILGMDACFPDSVVGFVPSIKLGQAKYFEYFMRTAKAHLLDFAPSTAQKNINLSILQNVLIPIPPASEIERIVEKIDQLMDLCDDLENKLLKCHSDGKILLESAVTDLLAA